MALREVMKIYRLTFVSVSQNYKNVIPSVVAATRKNYSSDAKHEEFYDVVIAGGGMVGTSLACAIANNRILENKKVLLVEGGPKQTYVPQEKYSNRVVALNQLTRTLLSSMGAWKHIEAVRCCPVRKMQVWDACSDAMITFNENFIYDELAYIVENDLLLHAINKQLSEKKNVTVIYKSKVTDVKFSETSCSGFATIRLQSGKQIRSKLLVGADGMNSVVRKAMGVQYVNWQYDQLGIVATLKLSEPTENVVAWQRFLPSGPIALLPLTDSLSSLVWSMTHEEAKELLKISEEEFVDRINKALSHIYPKNGIIESGMCALRQLLEGMSLQTDVSRQLQPSVAAIVEGSRAAFPLGFGHAVCYVHPGAALVGDAAHKIHPLAGQGVNMGFGDVVTLTRILAEATRNGLPFISTQELQKYETLRQQQNIPTMLVIDALHRLYKTTAAPVVLGRSLAMQLINAVPHFKKLFIDQASGDTICKH